MNNALKGNNNIYDGSTPYNQMTFLIRKMLKEISTAIPVKVINVYANTQSVGYVDVLPLVGYIGGNGEMVQPVTLYHLPYYRLQGGNVAIVIDPVIGDIGLAVFCQSDSSNVTAGTENPIQPASNRTHSLSDGYYIGGFLNSAPSCYVELQQDNTITITAPTAITINSPNTTINGQLTVTGDVVSGGVSLQQHVHSGVTSGSGNTGTPIGG